MLVEFSQYLANILVQQENTMFEYKQTHHFTNDMGFPLGNPFLCMRQPPLHCYSFLWLIAC